MFQGATRTNRWQDRIAVFLFVVPLVSLALGAISWIRYGIDLPFQDDWGEYRRGTAGSFGLETLFRPGGDTLHPVGKFFDAAAQNLLNGNAVLYQLISMIAVLGLLLFLQWRLLRLALDSRLSVALAFLLTIFTLQPDTYWGRQNMGFHQAIPLVCVLGALYLAVTRKPDSRWSMLLALAISLISGFSYISGAIAMLMTGLTLVAFGIYAHGDDARRMRNVGIALLAGALISVPAQLWVIFGAHGGQTHRPDASWTFPYQVDFWLYLLGVVARSLLLPKKYPVASLAAAALLGIATIAIALSLVARLLRKQLDDPRTLRLAVVFVALFATIGAYLCIVTAGRAGLQSGEADAWSEVFAAGYRRFYFAWVTLALPWIAAFALRGSGADKGVMVERRPPYRFVVPAALIVCTFAIVEGAFSHAGYYAKLNRGRMETQVKCLEDQLRTGAGILCPRLHPGDLASAYVYANGIGSSFLRKFPLPTVRLGQPGPEPLFRLSAAEPQTWSVQGMAVESAEPDGLSLKPTDEHAALVVRPPATETLQACLHLQVGITVSATQPNAVRLFFGRAKMAGFVDAIGPAQSTSASGAGLQELYFHAESRWGFESVIEIRPAAGERELRIGEIELRCLLRKR